MDPKRGTKRTRGSETSVAVPDAAAGTIKGEAQLNSLVLWPNISTEDLLDKIGTFVNAHFASRSHATADALHAIEVQSQWYSAMLEENKQVIST